jgi:hypothetical protein
VSCPTVLLALFRTLCGGDAFVGQQYASCGISYLLCTMFRSRSGRHSGTRLEWTSSIMPSLPNASELGVANLFFAFIIIVYCMSDYKSLSEVFQLASAQIERASLQQSAEHSACSIVVSVASAFHCILGIRLPRLSDRQCSLVFARNLSLFFSFHFLHCSFSP